MNAPRETNIQVHYESDYVVVGYDNMTNFTFMRIKRKGSSEEFRTAHDKAFELYKTKLSAKHVADTSAMGVVSIDDQRYVSSEFIPNIKKFHPREQLKIGVIVSDDVFSKFAVKNIISKTNDSTGVVHKMFRNISETINWFNLN